MLRFGAVAILLTGIVPCAFGSHLSIQMGEDVRRRLPEHRTLAELEGHGSTWANCIFDLAQRILEDTRRLQTLAGEVRWQWYPSGTWYTLQTSDRDDNSYQLQFRATFEKPQATCRLKYDYGFYGPFITGGGHPDSVLYTHSDGRSVLTMGAVPNHEQNGLYYYCQGC